MQRDRQCIAVALDVLEIERLLIHLRCETTCQLEPLGVTVADFQDARGDKVTKDRLDARVLGLVRATKAHIDVVSRIERVSDTSRRKSRLVFSVMQQGTTLRVPKPARRLAMRNQGHFVAVAVVADVPRFHYLRVERPAAGVVGVGHVLDWVDFAHNLAEAAWIVVVAVMIIIVSAVRIVAAQSIVIIIGL